MELVFNELSFRDYKNDSVLIENFARLGVLFEKAKTKFGYSHLLFPANLATLQACEDKNFGEWLNTIPTKEKNKIFPIIFKRPFTEEYLGDKTEALASYFFSSESLQIEQEYCDGLATADIMDIPAISLANHEVWLQGEINIFKETGTAPVEIQVKNLATEDFLNSEVFSEYSESISTVNLQPSSLSVEQKSKNISLRDDHGKDILRRFAEKVIKNCYVNGIINSLPFNPNTSRFIKAVYKDGRVEVVLHWEDAGYGMVIDTTGRNFRETDEIAKLLRDEFDK